ncbi:UvrD/REP helicase domain-containing protein [Toxoplasma gondii ARI]|uniref:DNA 3'-5' helicase n=1 Tax=Toxoplasma gondii ARI TaxID=1074872 RepID=A0A139XP66_TOXGO|nr:UvrD/REP helicase domain-containing protein [Toxoplasma gondii ARI]
MENTSLSRVPERGSRSRDSPRPPGSSSLHASSQPQSPLLARDIRPAGALSGVWTVRSLDAGIPPHAGSATKRFASSASSLSLPETQRHEQARNSQACLLDRSSPRSLASSQLRLEPAKPWVSFQRSRAQRTDRAHVDATLMSEAGDQNSRTPGVSANASSVSVEQTRLLPREGQKSSDARDAGSANQECPRTSQTPSLERLPAPLPTGLASTTLLREGSAAVFASKGIPGRKTSENKSSLSPPGAVSHSVTQQRPAPHRSRPLWTSGVWTPHHEADREEGREGLGSCASSNAERNAVRSGTRETELKGRKEEESRALSRTEMKTNPSPARTSGSPQNRPRQPRPPVSSGFHAASAPFHSRPLGASPSSISPSSSSSLSSYSCASSSSSSSLSSYSCASSSSSSPSSSSHLSTASCPSATSGPAVSLVGATGLRVPANSTVPACGASASLASHPVSSEEERRRSVAMVRCLSSAAVSSFQSSFVPSACVQSSPIPACAPSRPPASSFSSLSASLASSAASSTRLASDPSQSSLSSQSLHSSHSLHSSLPSSLPWTSPGRSRGPSSAVPLSPSAPRLNSESSDGTEKPPAAFGLPAGDSLPSASRELLRRSIPFNASSLGGGKTQPPSSRSATLPSSAPSSFASATTRDPGVSPSRHTSDFSRPVVVRCSSPSSSPSPSRASTPAPSSPVLPSAASSASSYVLFSSLRPPRRPSAFLKPSVISSASLPSLPGSAGGASSESSAIFQSDTDAMETTRGGNGQQCEDKDRNQNGLYVDERARRRRTPVVRAHEAKKEGGKRMRSDGEEREREAEGLAFRAVLPEKAKGTRREETEEEVCLKEEAKEEGDAEKAVRICEAEKLLPPHSKIFGQLSEEQRRVVLAPAHANLCVIAGPGSGKTTAITARILRLLLEGEGPILALTFTRRGAEELRTRVVDGLSSTLAEMRLLSGSRENGALPSAVSPRTNAATSSTASARTNGGDATIFNAPLAKLDWQRQTNWTHPFAPASAAGPHPRCDSAPVHPSVTCYSSSTVAPSASASFASLSASLGEQAPKSAAAAPGLPLFHDLAGRVLVGTFHKFGLLVLRRHGRAVGVPPSFLVATATRQGQLAREVLEAFKAREEARGAMLKSAREEPGRPQRACGVGNLEAAFQQVRRLHLLRMQRELAERQRERAARSRGGGPETAESRATGKTGETGEADICLDEAALDSDPDDLLDFLTDEEEEESGGFHSQHSGLPAAGRTTRREPGEACGGRQSSRGPVALHMGSRVGSTKSRTTWKEVDMFLRLVRKCKFSEAFLDTLKTENAQLYALTRQYAALLRQQTPPLLDCADLILLTLALLESQPNIRRDLATAYPIVVVDEFQDTSLPQFKVVKALALGRQEQEREQARERAWMHETMERERGEGRAGFCAGNPGRQEATRQRRGGVTVVGDDDQSIYGFRGIDAKNFLIFDRAFPDRLEFHLSCNYRSVAPIVSASLALINHNRHRRLKRLYPAARPFSSFLSSFLFQAVLPPHQMPSPPLGSASAAIHYTPSHQANALTNSSAAASSCPPSAPGCSSAAASSTPSSSSSSCSSLASSPSPSAGLLSLFPPAMCAVLSSPKAEAAYILRFIVALKQTRKLCWGDFVILSRTNRGLKELEELLQDPQVLHSAFRSSPLPDAGPLPILSLSPSLGEDEVENQRASSSASSPSSLAAPRSPLASLSSTLCLSPVTSPPSLWYRPDRPPDPSLLCPLWASSAFPEALPLHSTALKRRGTQMLRKQGVLLVCGYLRLALDPHHDASFLRVLNRPRRGLGLAVVRALCRCLQTLEGDAASPAEAGKPRSEAGNEETDAAEEVEEGEREGVEREGEGKGGRRRKRGREARAQEGARQDGEEGEEGEGGGRRKEAVTKSLVCWDAKWREGPLEGIDRLRKHERQCDAHRGSRVFSLYEAASIIAELEETAENGEGERKRNDETNTQQEGEAGTSSRSSSSSSANPSFSTPSPSVSSVSGSSPSSVDLPVEDHATERLSREKKETRLLSGSLLKQTKCPASALPRLRRFLEQLQALRSLARSRTAGASDLVLFVLKAFGLEAFLAGVSGETEGTETLPKTETEKQTTETADQKTLERRKERAEKKKGRKKAAGAGRDDGDEVCRQAEEETWGECGAGEKRGDSAVRASGEGTEREMQAKKLRKKNDGPDREKRTPIEEKRQTEKRDRESKTDPTSSTSVCSSENKLEDAWTLLRLAEGYTPNALQPTGWDCLSRFLKDLTNDRCGEAETLQRRNSIFLSTIHQAKGLEWPVVILAKANEGHLPLSNEDTSGSFVSLPARLPLTSVSSFSSSVPPSSSPPFSPSRSSSVLPTNRATSFTSSFTPSSSFTTPSSSFTTPSSSSSFGSSSSSSCGVPSSFSSCCSASSSASSSSSFVLVPPLSSSSSAAASAVSSVSAVSASLTAEAWQKRRTQEERVWAMWTEKKKLEEQELEEERRLCYVALTRAKSMLLVTCSKTEKSGQSLRVSRFVSEAKLFHFHPLSAASGVHPKSEKDPCRCRSAGTSTDARGSREEETETDRDAHAERRKREERNCQLGHRVAKGRLQEEGETGGNEEESLTKGKLTAEGQKKEEEDWTGETKAHQNGTDTESERNREMKMKGEHDASEEDIKIDTDISYLLDLSSVSERTGQWGRLLEARKKQQQNRFSSFRCTSPSFGRLAAPSAASHSVSVSNEGVRPVSDESSSSPSELAKALPAGALGEGRRPSRCGDLSRGETLDASSEGEELKKHAGERESEERSRTPSPTEGPARREVIEEASERRGGDPRAAEEKRREETKAEQDEEKLLPSTCAPKREEQYERRNAEDTQREEASQRDAQEAEAEEELQRKEESRNSNRQTLEMYAFEPEDDEVISLGSDLDEPTAGPMDPCRDAPTPGKEPEGKRRSEIACSSHAEIREVVTALEEAEEETGEEGEETGNAIAEKENYEQPTAEEKDERVDVREQSKDSREKETRQTPRVARKATERRDGEADVIVIDEEEAPETAHDRETEKTQETTAEPDSVSKDEDEMEEPTAVEVEDDDEVEAQRDQDEGARSTDENEEGGRKTSSKAFFRSAQDLARRVAQASRSSSDFARPTASLHRDGHHTALKHRELQTSTFSLPSSSPSSSSPSSSPLPSASSSSSGSALSSSGRLEAPARSLGSAAAPGRPWRCFLLKKK